MISSCFTVLLATALAQSQWAAKQNIADELLGCQAFFPEQLSSLEVNRECIVGVANVISSELQNGSVSRSSQHSWSS